MSSKIELHLEKIIERQWRLQLRELHLAGSNSPSLIALLLSQAETAEFHSRPNLLVTPTESDAQKIMQGINFFEPGRSCTALSGFDVSPYSTLYPSRRLIAQRCRFLWRAQNAIPGEIFVAPIEFLLQKTLPFAEFARRCSTWRKNSDVPSQLAEYLVAIGYAAAPIVEDVGQFSIRGGIVDLFSPAHDRPIRLELFGDTIESLRDFDVESQGSMGEVHEIHVIPCREFIWSPEACDQVLDRFQKSLQDAEPDRSSADEALRAIARQNDFDGLDFLFPFFFDKASSVLEQFSSSLNIWLQDPVEISRRADSFLQVMNEEYSSSRNHLIRISPPELWLKFDELQWPDESRITSFHPILMQESIQQNEWIDYPTFSAKELAQTLHNYKLGSDPWLDALHRKISTWKKEGFAVFFAFQNQSQAERLRMYLERFDWNTKIQGADRDDWHSWTAEQGEQPNLLHTVLRRCDESITIPDQRFVVIRDEDIFGRKTRSRSSSQASADFQKKAKRLNFGDLKPNDFIVHAVHGVGVYDGLKVMDIAGVESEFIQLSYRDKDKLYLPVYRVGQLQKYSGQASHVVLDKLGSQQFEKTKAKIRAGLRDLAAELLELYAKRAEKTRPAYTAETNDFASFEASFPYDETEDQLRATGDLVKDMTSNKPMDRLICGDVGFGKTEVAMRAAFVSAQNRKQVLVLAPTTVLAFQHFETFRTRFAGWPFDIRVVNRFVSSADLKKTLADTRSGAVDILIGTHRLLSKDVEVPNLGLLIIDEEQKFGVTHKERIRKFRESVDTLAMSATPIPRTLNMSLVGIRDLSLINTAPVDRLPTRTFIARWEPEAIRKALLAEVQRGGQIYFIHNRVQSIHGIVDEIRQLVPELRIGVGHGQMDEDQLEKTMIAFFHHEIDVLVCTTIVESGMDVPKANTMFIDQAHMLGLSQLYQLRGRVGRSKQRAYCYLLVPPRQQLDKLAQERLKVIQQNTALGSGIRIAQYDLELRGAGNLLGEQQSGHIDDVGYEMYMDLLNEAIAQLKGDPIESQLEPEINLRIPAMIPADYIGDIRMRLSYYKALADAQSGEELDQIESELQDQFGPLPGATINLLGLMLIRSTCRRLGIKDVSAGPRNLSLSVSDRTQLSRELIVKLATRENKKYSITPDNRLYIRMQEITWPRVNEELQLLERALA